MVLFGFSVAPGDDSTSRPTDQELNEAFAEYYTESAGVLKIQDQPGALVQVLNVFPPPHLVGADQELKMLSKLLNQVMSMPEYIPGQLIDHI